MTDKTTDTFPAWLAQRFDPQGAPWDGMSDDDRSYWEHQARAVRRAVARGGFNNRGHATEAETVPALLATINELRAMRAPLVDALTTVYESMTSCVGNEWAEEWLGEVWSRLPLDVRALAGDQDATAELAATQGALPMPAGPHVDVATDEDGMTLTFTSTKAGEPR